MDEKTENRIHSRIDETHKLINDTKIDYAEQKQMMKNLDETVKAFIGKVE